MLRLYDKNSVYDYLHKWTRYIIEYCKEQQINTVMIGDIKHIRDDANLGSKTNQKLHSLSYKLRILGIILQKQ